MRQSFRKLLQAHAFRVRHRDDLAGLGKFPLRLRTPVIRRLKLDPQRLVLVGNRTRPLRFRDELPVQGLKAGVQILYPQSHPGDLGVLFPGSFLEGPVFLQNGCEFARRPDRRGVDLTEFRSGGLRNLALPSQKRLDLQKSRPSRRMLRDEVVQRLDDLAEVAGEGLQFVQTLRQAVDPFPDTFAFLADQVQGSPQEQGWTLFLDHGLRRSGRCFFRRNEQALDR